MSRFAELRRARALLGTYVEICARAANREQVRVGLTSAFAAIERVQTLMSFHDAQSELSRLNRQAFREPVRVHHWTWQVLAAAQDFSVRSRGVFDVTIAPVLSQWGFLPRRNATDPAATFRDIVLLPDRMVRFRRALAIDFGGIAKGFAVDRAVECLLANGVSSGCVNAGGDLRVFGDEPQEIRLRDPANAGRAAGLVQLRNRAIATSGIYFSRKTFEGRLVSPLLDARTRTPQIAPVSVAVSARDCLTADALTKIILALGDNSARILREYRADAVVLERGLEPRVLSTNAPQFR